MAGEHGPTASDLAERLTALLDASLGFVEERDPHELLSRFLATACRLLDARYGALLIDDAGVLADFLTWGIDDHTAAAIGDPPTRAGLHGFLLKGGRTLRIDDLTTDDRCTGFPAHHPVLHAFIGTPLRYRGRTLGELYLAEKHGGRPFDADDQRILEALAAQAAAAYSNAQLLANERRAAAQATALIEHSERAEVRQAVFQRLVWAEEEERTRMAREVHDGLGQILTSAALFAKGIEETVDGEVAAQVALLRALMEKAQVSARALVRGLRPVELDDVGLPAALERLVADMGDAGLRVDLHTPSEWPDVPREVETAVYRVIQEALTNVVRHAHATWASVVIGRHEGKLVVIVEDDGDGFDRRALGAHGMRGEQLGLLGMQERAASVGAELSVDSEPGGGTLVRLEVPAVAVSGPTGDGDGDGR